MSLPTLVVVSGPAGTGKTTLAHALALRIGCPAISRDEIKGGMAFTTEQFIAAPNDELTRRTLPAFFGLVGELLNAGVTVVAEAAFQHHVWEPNLEPLMKVARICVVQCHADEAAARRRMQARNRRSVHADSSVLNDVRYFRDFDRLHMDLPSIHVDSTNGYQPTMDEVVQFVRVHR